MTPPGTGPALTAGICGLDAAGTWGWAVGLAFPCHQQPMP